MAFAANHSFSFPTHKFAIVASVFIEIIINISSASRFCYYIFVKGKLSDDNYVDQFRFLRSVALKILPNMQKTRLFSVIRTFLCATSMHFSFICSIQQTSNGSFPSRRLQQINMKKISRICSLFIIASATNEAMTNKILY